MQSWLMVYADKMNAQSVYGSSSVRDMTECVILLLSLQFVFHKQTLKYAHIQYA